VLVLVLVLEALVLVLVLALALVWVRVRPVVGHPWLEDVEQRKVVWLPEEHHRVLVEEVHITIMVELVVAMMELTQMDQEVVDNMVVDIHLHHMDISIMMERLDFNIMVVMADIITGPVVEVDGMEAEVVDIMIKQELVDHHMLVI
jgi:hypothetical protein